MEKKYNDTFLARWLANDLTTKEIEEFEASEDFKAYKQIIEAFDNAELPEFNIDENFTKTLKKIEGKNETKPKKGKLISLISFSTAASIAILILGYNIFFKTTIYQTELAQKTKFKLPDASTVNLNADSKISYNAFDWKTERTLNLEGEAFFKVKKGSRFSVQSKQGTVSVLGTQFKVNTRENIFHITCFEGKVLLVTTKKDSVYLSKNQSFRLFKNQKEEFEVKQQKPSWIQNESRFDKMPILLVLEELERQFGVSIEGKQQIKNELFSGSFSHKNAKVAIQSVLEAMEIKYTFDKQGKVIIK